VGDFAFRNRPQFFLGRPWRPRGRPRRQRGQADAKACLSSAAGPGPRGGGEPVLRIDGLTGPPRRGPGACGGKSSSRSPVWLAFRHVGVFLAPAAPSFHGHQNHLPTGSPVFCYRPLIDFWPLGSPPGSRASKNSMGALPAGTFFLSNWLLAPGAYHQTNVSLGHVCSGTCFPPSRFLPAVRRAQSVRDTPVCRTSVADLGSAREAASTIVGDSMVQGAEGTSSSKPAPGRWSRSRLGIPSGRLLILFPLGDGFWRFGSHCLQFALDQPSRIS